MNFPCLKSRLNLKFLKSEPKQTLNFVSQDHISFAKKSIPVAQVPFQRHHENKKLRLYFLSIFSFLTFAMHEPL